MQYLGGKSRMAKDIARLIGPVDTYVEPFCGGLSVASRMRARRMIIGDANPALVTLYQHWLDGWRPEPVDEARWRELKDAADPDDPYTAFAGFGMSFAGKWYAGYAHPSAERDYFSCAVSSLTAKMARISHCRPTFICSSYDDLDIPDDAVVYCDPPYADTTGYAAVGAFDSDAFWRWAIQRPHVYVSEYTAPPEWETLLEREQGVATSGGAPTKTAAERVFAPRHHHRRRAPKQISLF